MIIPGKSRGRLFAGYARSPHLAVGVWGEMVAEKALRRKGYRTLGRRVRIGARDEIDLVMEYDNTLIFVEVKTRANENYGQPATAIGKRKRHALARAAQRYLLHLKESPVFYRFDVVEVTGSPQSPAPPAVNHIESALVVSKAPFPL